MVVVVVGTFLVQLFRAPFLCSPKTDSHQLEKDLCYFRLILSILIPGTLATAVNKTGPALLQFLLSQEQVLFRSSFLTRFYFFLEVPSPGLPLSGEEPQGGGKKQSPAQSGAQQKWRSHHLALGDCGLRSRPTLFTSK